MKKLLSLILAITLCLFLATPALAAGSDFEIENGVLIRYTGRGGNVVIPDGVTEIGVNAFYDHDLVTSVTIPSSVKRIGDSAFDSCYNLAEVTIPESVTEIGTYAFYSTSLQTATIPTSVTELGAAAFALCPLSKITVAAGNLAYRDIDGVVFNKAGNELIAYPGGRQGAYTIPDNVFRIESCAFNGCRGLTYVRIPDSVTEIGEYAFDVCNALTEVFIPASVTRIGKRAFHRNGLTMINVDENNPCFRSTDGILLNKSGSELICFPSGRSGSQTIPAGVTDLGEDGIRECVELTEIIIPEGVTSIGGSTFGGCFHLTSITLPSSLTTIDDSGFAFYNIYELHDVYFRGTKAQWDAIRAKMSLYSYASSCLSKAIIHYNVPLPSAPAAVGVTVNNTAVQWTDATPFIDANNRTMVPLRAVAEALGLTVDWDGTAREAIFTDGTKTIYFPIGSSTARTGDGGTVQMDTAAVIVNDRTFAPIRYLAEFFGFTVDWDGETRTVLIHR